jgi:hypothetical protein
MLTVASVVEVRVLHNVQITAHNCKGPQSIQIITFNQRTQL